MEDVKKTILLVEDDVVIALIKIQRLKKIGYDVLHSTTGEKAVKVVSKGKSSIDLILMDIDLGKGMDGSQTAQEILKNCDIPIVFLSSHTEKEVVKKTEKITSYGYIDKDSDITVLNASIKMAFKLFDAHIEINKKNMAIKAGNENLRVTIKQLETANNALIQSEKKLRINAERTRRAHIIGRVGNWEYDIKTNRIWGSEGAKKIYNIPLDTGTFSLDEIEAMDCDKERLKQSLMDLIYKGAVYDLEFKIKPVGSNEWKWLHSIAELEKDENGNTIKVVGVVRDITIQKEYEASLLKLSQAIDNSSDIIFMLDKDGIINFMNPRFTDVYGYTKEEIIGIATPGILNHEIVDAEKEIFFWKYPNSTESYKSDFKNKSKNGNLIFVEATIDPLFNVYGELTGFLEIQRDVTYRRDAEEKIRQSEESLSIMLQSIGDAVIATDVNGAITLINPPAEKLTGWSCKDALNKPLPEVFRIIDAKTRKAVEDPVNKVLKYGKIVGLANGTALISKTGNEYQIADSAAPICDKDGAIQGVILVFSDISEKYEAAKQIASLARFPEENPNPVLRISSDGALLYSNLAASELLEQRLHTDKQKISDEWIEIIKNVYTSNRSLEQDFILQNTKTFHFVFTPVKDSDYVNVYGLDISERKKEESERNRLEKLFEAMFNNIPDAVIITDKDHKIQLANKGVKNIFGYEDDELIGRLSGLLYSSTEAFKEAGSAVFDEDSKRREFRFVSTYIDKSHRVFSGETIGAKLYDNKGHWIGNLAITRNISQQTKLISDLSAAKERAEESEKEKELLMKEVHHRIKNNMSTIEGLLSIQANSLENREAAEALRDAGKRVHCMMLLYDKLYRSEDVDHLSINEYLSPLIANILSNISLPETKITKKVNVGDIILDAKRMSILGIIINEIVTNIVKYAFVGRETGEITIEALDKANHIMISIEDNGVGIPEEVVTSDTSGFGIKLVQMLTQQLDGTLQIERREGTKVILKFDR